MSGWRCVTRLRGGDAAWKDAWFDRRYLGPSTKRVSPTCLVHLERNSHSVPASFGNLPVRLRVYTDRVVVAAEGQIVCEHRRIIDRSHDRPGHSVYDWRHYLAVVQRKPAALRNGASF